MRFPNAYKGISKVLLAEILQLIGTVVGIVAGVFMLMVVEGDPEILLEGSLVTVGVSTVAVIVAGVVGIIAFILNLVGLVQAKKDDNGFRYALIFTVICIVLAIVAAFIVNINPVLSDWMSFVVTIFELCVFEYVVVGIMSLAQKLGDEKMVAFGSKMRLIITILYIVVLVMQLFGRFNIAFAGVMTTILGIIELVLYIAYLIYLIKARTMLAK